MLIDCFELPNLKKKSHRKCPLSVRKIFGSNNGRVRQRTLKLALVALQFIHPSVMLWRERKR